MVLCRADEFRRAEERWHEYDDGSIAIVPRAIRPRERWRMTIRNEPEDTPNPASPEAGTPNSSTEVAVTSRQIVSLNCHGPETGLPHPWHDPVRSSRSHEADWRGPTVEHAIG